MLCLITSIVLLLRSKCICIFCIFYCIVKYCIVLSRHILVYFLVFYFSVFSAYVANKRSSLSSTFMLNKYDYNTLTYSHIRIISTPQKPIVFVISFRFQYLRFTCLINYSFTALSYRGLQTSTN